MSVNRDFKLYELYKYKKGRSLLGAETKELEKVGNIKVAVYKKGDRIVSGSEKYREATHVALTHYKELKAGTYQLRRRGKIFDITDANLDNRLASLLLKEVDADA